MSENRILVAVDHGPESERALDHAIDLAVKLGATLELVHACPPPPPPLPAEDPVYIDRGKKLLADGEARAHLRGVDTVPHLIDDAAVFSILQLIDERQPQLVVVGSHGRRGLQRALLGSVSESLARRSPVPVLIVPSPSRRQNAERAAWSCNACGHILGKTESSSFCAQCGASPADWISAPIVEGPVDIAEPSTGESVAGDLTQTQTNEPMSLFSTAPAGAEGYDVNPELRVRY